MLLEIDSHDQPTFNALLGLNNLYARELSLLYAQRFTRLLAQSFWARRISDQAFILTFDQTADYDSPNFLWFRARYPRFVYVDRVVVAATARGRGYARTLYEALLTAAHQAGYDRVVCEVNAAPPNAASDAFHAAMGFTEVGSAHIHDGAKLVRYFAREVG